MLCRTFDSALAEVCHLEGVGLLAYSPLAMGLLTVIARVLTARVLAGHAWSARMNCHRYRVWSAAAGARGPPKALSVLQLLVTADLPAKRAEPAFGKRFYTPIPRSGRASDPQGKYEAEGGGPLGARLNRYRGRYAEAESRWGRPGPRAGLKCARAGGCFCIFTNAVAA